VGSPQSIDIEALLAPVSEAAPTGSNIRDDQTPSSVYFRLKDSRNAGRAAERRADTEGDSQTQLPEWKTARDLALDILVKRSKDLEVAAWLIEALVRTNGFAGLRDGLSLTRLLVERYWDTLFSLEDEEGIVTKVAPLTGLNGLDADGTLIQPIRKVPLTKPGDEGAFAAYHYDQAVALSQIKDPEVRARREQSGAVTLEKFTAAVNASGGPYYVALLADIEESLTELDELSKVLDERAGQAAPPNSAIHNALTAVQEAVQRFSKDLVAREKLASEDAGADAGNGQAAVGAAGGGMISDGPIRNREDALRVLLQVAAFFEKYEPHSPIATSLQETVRRAQLSFSELLAELVADRNAWRSALASAGIKPPEES
jgi:type VI secretion system protein ImpA